MTEQELKDRAALGGCGCVVFLILMIGLMGLSYISQSEMVTGVVDNTYIKRTGGGDNPGDSFFVVVDKEGGGQEVFQNDDSVFFGKFNSADVQAKMKVGSRVRFKAIGWRWPLFSVFRNIVKVEQLGGK